ncbi:MAG: hypothetical protein ACRDT0_21465 [Pseudonocardiaceae bacterium]
MAEPHDSDSGDAAAAAALAEAVSLAEAEDGTGQAGQAESGSGEAAKYRRRLREAESERDALRSRLDASQRREVERFAGADLARGDDVWLGGAELAALLDDAGNVDPGKVAETTAALLAERPHWAPRHPTADPDQGRKTEGRSVPSFADFLRDAGGVE